MFSLERELRAGGPKPTYAILIDRHLQHFVDNVHASPTSHKQTVNMRCRSSPFFFFWVQAPVAVLM